jgi:hypothetical protein
MKPTKRGTRTEASNPDGAIRGQIVTGGTQ